MLQGIYYHGLNFFRFYKNGTFIHCLIRVEQPTEANFRKIMEWFTPESPMVKNGTYTFKNGAIQFSIKAQFGDRLIDYQGKTGGKKLIFETLNHNTGKRTRETYTQIMLSRT